MMSEMIERVARAIAKTEICGEELWEDFESHARAVLKAMREPTHSMTMVNGAGDNHHYLDYEARATWQKMIDEALK